MYKLDLHDTMSEYHLDVISCYERPFANVLNYYSSYCGDLFVIVSKMYDSFKNEFETSTRDKIVSYITKNFGVEVEYCKKFKGKEVAGIINDGNPVIACANLREVFYTRHYCKNDWPHWFLLKGFDGQTHTFCTLDNEQFSIVGSPLDEFNLSEELLKKAADSYYDVMSKHRYIRISKKDNFEYSENLIKILQLYVSYDKNNCEIYSQKKALEEIIKLSVVGGTYSIVEQLKKRIVNVNKYKNLIATILSKQLCFFGYNDLACDLTCAGENNAKAWINYVMRTMVDINKGKISNIVVSQSVIGTEIQLDKVIKRVLDRVISDREIIDEKYRTISEKVEEDNIISAKDGVISFLFNNNKIYNWWLEDECPKHCILKKDITKTKTFVSCSIMTDKNSLENKYQAGIYVKNSNSETLIDKAYMNAIDKEGNIVISKIGEWEHIHICDTVKDVCLYAEVNGNEVIFGKIENDNKEEIERVKFDNVGITEIGLTCKTWGNGERLKNDFYNIIIN